MEHHTIKETADIHIFRDLSGDIPTFVKQAKTAAGVVENTREFHNQTFLYHSAQGKDIGFDFLLPTFDGTSLIYPDISTTHQWLATDMQTTTDVQTFESYRQELFTFLKWCLDIPYSDIPSEIRVDSDERRLLNGPRFETDVAYLLEHALITQTQAEQLHTYLEQHFDTRAFQHHDIVPWHMAKDIQTGRITLVDGGWSSWSFRYYDIAYYTLQMIGHTGNTTDAYAFWDLAKKEFSYDPHYMEIIATPLSYRSVRFAAELNRQNKLDSSQQILSTMWSLFQR
jgi:hypothetical protein